MLRSPFQLTAFSSAGHFKKMSMAPCPIATREVELGEALKKVFGLSDEDLTPVYVYPENLNDEEDEKAR